MVRKTKKLLAALDALGEVKRPLCPSGYYYARCEVRGLAWDGKEWRKPPERAMIFPAVVVVHARSSHDVLCVSDFLALALHQAGYRVTVHPYKRQGLHIENYLMEITLEGTRDE